MITFTEKEVRAILERGKEQVKRAIHDTPVSAIIDGMYVRGAESAYNFMVLELEFKAAMKGLGAEL
jgi:hypothetical protein